MNGTCTIAVHLGMPASEVMMSDNYGVKYTHQNKRQESEIDINIRLDYSQLDVVLQAIRDCLDELGIRE